ncbi:hypothetical protein LCGC14_0526310 [marine sediment metagenome]|uniref:Uncharacterized protein n=1 Tax=marine sediment metagenome TaxID=412755 RepID=A0A0F9UID9_9ZZZZ
MTMVASKKISDKVKDTHLKILKRVGEDGLCRQAIAACLFNQTKRKSPELEALDLSEAFLALYRRTGDDEFLIICRALRRAAHKVHWELAKKKKRKTNSLRFLTLC